MENQCAKFVGFDGASQCGRPAAVRVYPGTASGWWPACEHHGWRLAGRPQGPTGIVAHVEYFDREDSVPTHIDEPNMSGD